MQQHSIKIPEDADVAYNYSYANKVKKIYVLSEQQKQLTLGQLAIVVIENNNFLVPAKIAERIEERLPNVVIRAPLESVPEEDDPYANYQIPDDLMW